MTYVDGLVEGTYTVEDLDDFLYTYEVIHPKTQLLHEFLGFTKAEYRAYLQNKLNLNSIIKMRQSKQVFVKGQYVDIMAQDVEKYGYISGIYNNMTQRTANDIFGSSNFAHMACRCYDSQLNHCEIIEVGKFDIYCIYEFVKRKYYIITNKYGEMRASEH